MEYGRYVGRVGALAVALGIGVAVANGGVAQASPQSPSGDTESPGTTPSGSPPAGSPTNTAGSTAPDPSDPPETKVGTEEVEENDIQDSVTRIRSRARTILIDALDRANVATLGPRRAAAQDPDPGADAPGRQVDDSSGGVPVNTFTAPPHNDPVQQTLPGAAALQRTLRAVTAPPQRKLAPTPSVLPSATKLAAVADTLTTKTQSQAVTNTDTVALVAPAESAVATPVRLVMGLLSFIGVQTGAVTPASPVTPVGSFLELVGAALRRIDHTFFNETPTATPLVVDQNLTTGVVTGTVAEDADGDPLRYRIVDGPDHGEVVLNPDGTFTYTPDRNETHDVGETDEFTVVVSDRTNFHLHVFNPGGHTTTVTVSNIPVVPNNTVIDTIDDEGTTIQRPEDLAINHDGTRVYVTDSDANKVHVIDTSTNTIVASIPVSPGPDGLAVVTAADGKEYVYVASSQGVLGDPMNPSDDIVSVIDTSTNTVVATINLSPTMPMPDVAGLGQVAASPDGRKVYVTGFSGMYTINTADNTVDTGAFVSLEDEPFDSNRYDIAVTPDGQFAYLPDFAAPFETGDINIVNLGTGEVTKVDAAPDQFIEDVVVSPDGRYVYMTGESLIVLDTTTNTIVARNTDIGDGRGLAISPDGTRLYVAQINSDRVTVVDTQTLEIVDDIPVDSAWNVAVTPDGTRAYVVGFATPGVSVIALQTPTDPAVVV